MPHNDITITVYRGAEPVLVTGDQVVVSAVVDALTRALRGSERRPVLDLHRELTDPKKRERRPAEAAHTGGSAPDAADVPFPT